MLLLVPVLWLSACNKATAPQAMTELPATKGVQMAEGKINMSNDEWKKKLDPKAYEVMREHGTERPFSGEYVDHKDEGVYTCAACGFEIFASDHKFDSGSGWPSFDRPLSKDAIGESRDDRYGMERVEVHCPRCGGHLGHVFNDGPSKTTGMRYCINSCSLKFKKK